MKLTSFFKNEFIRGTLILLILSNLGNLLNFIFQFLMARKLSLEEFGILSFLGNLLLIFGVPSLAIQTLISKKVIEFKKKGKVGQIRGLIVSAFSYLFIIACVVMGLYFLLIGLFKDQIGIDFALLGLFSSLIFASLLSPIVTGLLQGLKYFSILGFALFFLFLVKLLLGLGFIYSGFGLYGAVIAIIISSYSIFLFIAKPLAKIRSKLLPSKFNMKQDFFIVSVLLLITLFYSLDLLIAKFVLDPSVLGNYSKISLIGKILVFTGLSIGNVMLPLSLERKLDNLSSNKMFRKALVLNGFFCGLGLIIFYFFGNYLFEFLFGSIVPGSKELYLLTLAAFSLISFTILIVLYSLSQNNFSFIKLITYCLLLICQLIILVTSINLESFIYGFFYSSLAIFILAILLSLKWKKSV